MRKIIIASLVLFIYLQSSAQIQWHNNYELAKAVAKSEGKLLLIDFWAIWCGPCQNMDRKLWTASEMDSISQRFVAYKMDIDSETALANRYSIKSIPRVVLITPDEEIIWDKTGFSSNLEYLKAFQHIPTNLSELFQAIDVNVNEESQESLFRLGEAYSNVAKGISYESLANDFFDMSNNYFRKAEKGESEIIAELAELNQILNVALSGNTKRALKKLEKADNPDSEITREFVSYVKAYCYKCEGQKANFDEEKSKIKNEKLIAELEKKNK